MQMLILRTSYLPVMKLYDETDDNGHVIGEYEELSDNSEVVFNYSGKEYFGFGCVYNIEAGDLTLYDDTYYDIHLTGHDYEWIEEVSAGNVFIGTEDEVHEMRNKLIYGELTDTIF